MSIKCTIKPGTSVILSFADDETGDFIKNIKGFTFVEMINMFTYRIKKKNRIYIAELSESINCECDDEGNFVLYNPVYFER